MNLVTTKTLKSAVVLRITDAESRTICQQLIAKGANSCVLNLTSLANGLYYYLLETAEGVVSRGKFVVEK